jgi:hypothetical protein
MEAGGRATSQYYELLARQRGIDPSTLSPYLNALRNVEQAQTRTGASTAQVANAMRMVPAQLSDIAVQLAGGQSPFMVLMQQGSQLRDSFGSVPATLRGVGQSLLGLVNPYTVAAAAAGALAYAYNEGSKEADGYNRAIIMSGNAAGVSTNQLANYAAQISKTVGTQAQAAQALAALTSTGEVGAENLQRFGTVAVQVQKYVGRSIDETVKDFAELGKSPVEASLKLSESYHYLTAATYEQVKALQDQGKTEEAAEVAQKAYADAFADRAAKMKDSLGSIERAWMGAKDSAAQAWDMFLGVGRKKSSAQALAEIQAQIALAKAPPITQGGDRGDNAAMRQAAAASNLPELLRKEKEAQYQVDKEAWEAQQAGITEQLRKASLEWDKVMEGTMSKADRLKLALKKVQEQGEAAGASDKAIQTAKNKVVQEYASLDNPALAALEGESRRQKEILAGQLSDLDSNYKQRIVSESQYIEQKRDLQLQENKLEIDLATKRAQIDKGKEDQSAYKKDLADLAVLAQQRLNIANGATAAMANADAARKTALDNLVGGWDRAIAAETDAIQQEVSLFGQSDQARAIAIAQIKLETDARKFVADQAKDGHALSAQEIADLNAKTDARKRELAATLNQKAAIAGAQRLLDENRKFSVDYIADADERARRVLEIDARQWQELIANTEAGSEARQKLIEQFDQWYANRQMTPVLDRWKGVINDLDYNFQEGFRDMLTNGQNAWSSFAKSIGNTLKTSLADALYQTFIKKYVVQIVAGFAGAISGPAVASVLSGDGSSAASVGGNGAIGAAQAASNVYKLISGSLNDIPDLIAGDVQKGMTGMGYNPYASQGYATAGGQALSPTAYYAGEIGGTLVGYGIGSTLNSAISGKYETGSGVMTAEKIGTAVASAIFGPVGGAVAGAISGGINRLFGMGPTEVQSQGLRGTLSASSLSGSSYQNLHQDGGVFRSDKNWTDTRAFTDAMVKQFTQGLAAIEGASSGFASSLGVQADWIKDYSKTFDLKLTGDATKDQQAITDFFSGIGDEIAKKLVPNLDELSKSGESASAALERLAGDFKGTDQIAQLLGFSASSLFGSTGLESAKAREQLIDLAGGLSALSSQAAFFNQNFLTDAERIKPVAEALDKALASLGLSSIPTTRDQFKGLVNDLITSGAAATESGAKQLDSLLALGEAFAQVHPDDAAEKAQKAAAILQERQGLQDQLDELTMSSVQLLGKQRAALDESNRALFDQVQAVKSQAAALQAVKDQASTMLAGVGDMYSVLQKVVSREKSAIQTSVDTHTAAFNKLQSLSQALHSTLDSLQSPEQKLFARSMAQAEIRSDLAITKAGGTLSDAQVESLKKALGAVTQDASKQFGSREDYMFDLLRTQNDIAQLGDITDDSLSIEQKSLDALNDQIKRLDAIVANGQAEIDALNGQSVATLSLAQALAAFQSSIGGAKSNPVVGGTSTVAGFYEDLLGRAPDKAGLQFWQDQLAKGVSLDSIRAEFMKGDEYKKLHPFAIGTNYVPQTMPALVHEGERIIPAADNRLLMSVLARASRPSDNGAVLADAVKGLQEENAKQREVIEGMAKDMAIMADVLKGASPGGSFLRVKGV